MTRAISHRIAPLAMIAMLAAACGDDGGATSSATGTDGSSTTAAESSGTATTATTAETSAETTATTTDAETSAADATGDTTAGETTAADATGDTTVGESTGTGTTGGLCNDIPFEPIAQEGLAGGSACEGVAQNGVIEDVTALEAHYAAYCGTLDMCFDPPPFCPMTPALDFDGQRIAYVFGSSSGCQGFATITGVQDCGDTVEVHYTVGANGDCALIVYGFDAAFIPAGDAEVVFVEA